MSNVLSVETMALDSRSDRQPGLGSYYFDLNPDYVDPDAYWVAIFKASDCRQNGLALEAPGWVSEYPSDSYVADQPWPVTCAIEDSEDRPVSSPLRLYKHLTYLDPRYGDAWVAFVLPVLEVA